MSTVTDLLEQHSPPHRTASWAAPTKDDAPRLRRAMDLFAVMCRHNSMSCAADSAGMLTPFHSVAEPPIALSEYVDRLDRQTHCGEEAGLIAIILFGRFCHATGTLPSVLSMHRGMLITIRVAVKAHHDIFRSNKAYANAGGMHLTELNELEAFLLSALDYRVLVSGAELAYLRAAMGAAAAAKDAPTLAQHLAAAIHPEAVNFALHGGTSAVRTVRMLRPVSTAEQLRQRYQVDEAAWSLYQNATVRTAAHQVTVTTSTAHSAAATSQSSSLFGAPANSDVTQYVASLGSTASRRTDSHASAPPRHTAAPPPSQVQRGGSGLSSAVRPRPVPANVVSAVAPSTASVSGGSPL